MNETHCRSTAHRMLEACSAEDIATILRDEELKYYFDHEKLAAIRKPSKLGHCREPAIKPGRRTGRVNHHGIDAILLRKAHEAGITDFRSPEAPQSV